MSNEIFCVNVETKKQYVIGIPYESYLIKIIVAGAGEPRYDNNITISKFDPETKEYKIVTGDFFTKFTEGTNIQTIGDNLFKVIAAVYNRVNEKQEE